MTREGDNLAPDIARLGRLGLSAGEIAERLGVPPERIAQTERGMTDAAPGGLGGRDATTADSHPASDPPASPAA